MRDVKSGDNSNMPPETNGDRFSRSPETWLPSPGSTAFTKSRGNLSGSWALPLWLADPVDADTRKGFFEITPVVVLIPFILWRYVFQTYIAKPGDRWTGH